MDTAEQLGIPIPRAGFNERHTCPQCSSQRKNKTDKCLSVKIVDDVVVFYCHHCGYRGNALAQNNNFKDDLTKLANRAKKIARKKTNGKVNGVPSSLMAVDKNSSQKNNTISNSAVFDSETLSKKTIAFLKDRKISQKTAAAFGVKSMMAWTRKAGRETECIAFPYRNDKGKVYAAKLRSTEVKAFTCKGAPQTLFNIERLRNQDQVVITEGEMDVLALGEVGIEAVSIPHGAVQPGSTNNDQRFAFIGHASSVLERASKIILAVDGDGPGMETAEELARRVGKAKCYQIDWPDGCKDANDVLINHGPDKLKDVVANATPWPVEGLYGADHYVDEVTDLYTNGLPPAASTGLVEVDKVYRVGKGQLTVVTGHPNHGKSEFINQIMVNMAANEGWKFALCSFENPPPIHIANLASKVIKRPFFGGDHVRMTRLEMERAVAFVKKHFVFLGSGDGLSTIDGIIDRLKSAVLRYGINGAVIDPYNYVARSNDKSETDTVSDMLTKIKAFCMAYDVHVWFVAHPTKMARNADGDVPPPKGYDISGSAAWNAKADMGLTVHRPDKTYSNKTEIHIWKVRFSWHGKDGVAEVYYQPHQCSYIDPP